MGASVAQANVLRTVWYGLCLPIGYDLASVSIDRQNGTILMNCLNHMMFVTMKHLIFREDSLRVRKSLGFLLPLRQLALRPTRVYLIPLLLGASVATHASTYYVDYSAGSDPANGTSTGTPWKHCPGDASASSTAAATTLAAGDTIYFKRGVVYTTGGISVSHSGINASPITYDGTGSAWGTGQAIIDGNYETGVGFTVAANISYITIAGFEIRNFGGYSDTNAVVLAAAAGTTTNYSGPFGEAIDCSAAGNTNLTFANLLIDRMGQWRNTIGWDGASVSGLGIYVDGQTGLIVTNCEISKCGILGLGIYATPNTFNCLVTSCYFHDNINWALDVSVHQDGGIINGLTITKCRFLNLNAMGGDFQGPHSDLLHQNYIFMRTATSATPWTNVTVSCCLFGDTHAYGSLGGSGGTGAIFLSQGPSVNIYNNVFAHSWSTTGVIPIGYATYPANQIVRIFNNTFYRDCAGSAVELTGLTGGATNRQVFIENNLIISNPAMTYNNSVDLNIDSGNWPAALDYNGYYSSVFDQSTRHVIVYANLASLKSSGYEAHGFWGNPLFNNPNPPALDCSIQTNSPAIGAGTNLSAFFTTDYSGNARPATGAWDVGAFQAGAVQKAAVVSVTPTSQNFGIVTVGLTTNKMFTVQNTGGGTLTGSASVSSPFSIVSGGSYSLGAGQSQTVMVAYSPTAAGTNAQSVTFTGAGGGSGTVSGAAYVPSTSISVTPASQNFGTVAVGTTTNQSFIVQNTAGGTLIGNVSVAAPFSIVSGGSYSLAAGQNQTVMVRYTPTAEGTNTATVSFSNIGGVGASAALIGTAVAQTVAPPVVSAITQSGADVDVNAAGLQIYAGSVVQYSGSASDPNGLPLTWQWSYTLNGGQQMVVESGTGTVANVSFNYTASTAGNTYVWTLLASNGISTAASTLTVGVEGPPPATASLTFQAGDGVITAPFVLNNGYISQPVQTADPTLGGQVVFTFTITNAGTYIIQALINAPTDANNSFFVNVDTQPSAPTNIWDISTTSGFEQRIVSWRGNGTDVNNQFVPAFFKLPAGEHQLVIRGREIDVQLQSLAILCYLPTPQLLHLSP
jgi:hypothetical protein